MKFNPKCQISLKANVSEMDIESVKCSTFFASENVNKCSTTDSRVKPFLDFKKLNESLFIYCDKSPNIAYITESDYKLKIFELKKNSLLFASCSEKIQEPISLTYP